MYIYQTTIDCVEKFTGIGLHSGKNVTVVLRPANADTGIIFIRKDKDDIHIKATASNVVNTTLSTVLAENGAEVGTVEHFMAALYALGIDNIIVELDGPEIPIMDGSASPFIYILKRAGIKNLMKRKKYIRITDNIEIADNDKKVGFYPSNYSELSFMLDYNHPLITKQFFHINLSKESFVEEISKARTFGFLHEVEFLRSRNLALGGSLDNAVVIDNNKILNPEGLRYENEFVRHKILDALGDISLLGYPVIGAYKGIKAGHYLNNELCRKTLESTDKWEIVEAEEKIFPEENEFFIYEQYPEAAAALG